MKVLLLRHGEAEKNAESDALRSLSKTGCRDINDVARQFAGREIPIDQCISSPLLRARESAELFLQASHSSCETISLSLLKPEEPARLVLRFLEDCGQESVLLVGHNPQISMLFALLTAGAMDYHMKIFSTAELCCIEAEFLGVGAGKHSFSLLPRPT